MTENSFKLTWTKSEDNVGVEGYEIFINGESVGKLKETGAYINNLLAGTEYKVVVKAYDKAGNYSDAAEITVKTSGKSNSGNNGNGGSTGKPSMKPVKTGDNAPIAVAAGAMIVSGLMVGALILRKK